MSIIRYIYCAWGYNSGFDIICNEQTYSPGETVIKCCGDTVSISIDTSNFSACTISSGFSNVIRTLITILLSHEYDHGIFYKPLSGQ